MKSKALRYLRWVIAYGAGKFSVFRKFKSIHRTLRAWLVFWSAYLRYTRMATGNEKPQLKFLFPCIYDATANTEIEPTYFYQDAWAFECIANVRPSYHVDVGSHHKYVALLSKVLPVTMVDIRPLSLALESLKFRKGSILSLPYESDTVPSISSLCVVEHIGLGRYGDPIDPHGTEKAIEELKRVVAPGGDLYLSIPLDDENRTYFNAHRAFTEKYLLTIFQPFQVIEKMYIFGNEFGAVPRSGFGTGCYWLKKPVEKS